MKIVTLLIYLNLILLSQPLVAQVPQLSHGIIYRSNIKVEEYLVSEKLDGVRAYWDGSHLLSRTGNIFHAPKWFTKSLPPIPLDGELWISRGSFEKVVSTVRKDIPVDKEWRQIKYMLFELPDSPGDFRQRYEMLQKIVNNSDLTYLKVINQRSVESTDQLNTLLNEVIEQGGEGLMLHRKNSLYTTGRTSDIIKVKKRFSAEAVVIKHLPGQGQFSGMLGSMLVEDSKGLRFLIGTGFSHQERQEPPPLGSTITYSYYGFTAKGIPRFPSFLRIRIEL